MPVCDGISATRLIHELDARLHVVIYTGSAEFRDVAKAEAAGAFRGTAHDSRDGFIHF